MNQLLTILMNLKAYGWKLILKESHTLSLPSNFTSRYPYIPESYKEFLMNVKSLSNTDDTMWFLTEDEIVGNTDSAFTWDEFERLSIDATKDSPILKQEINDFWSNHLPILFSVKSGYEYWAIKTSGEDVNKIVHGVEPEFEAVSFVADNLLDFLSQLK